MPEIPLRWKESDDLSCSFAPLLLLLLYLTLCDPMDRSTQGLPVPHYLLEFAQTHVH